MRAPVDFSGKLSGSKMDALRRVVDSLTTELASTPMVGFGLGYPKDVGVISSIPEPSGGTPLDLGIRFCTHMSATHLIVISDGAPDSESRAFAAAREFGGPIDVYYVGPRPDRGETFLQELARLSGGQCESLSLSNPKQLQQSLQRRLTA